MKKKMDVFIAIVCRVNVRDDFYVFVEIEVVKSK